MLSGDATSANRVEDTLMANLKGTASTHPTREKILQLAIAVIEEQGDEAVRVNDIAAEAGVSITSLYHFFGDRVGLVVAAQTARYLAPMTSEMDSFVALLDSCTTREQLADIITLVVAFSTAPNRRSIRRSRITVLGRAMTHTELEASVAGFEKDWCDALTPAFKRAREKGLLNQDLSVEVVAPWLVGTLLGRIVFELNATPAQDAIWDAMTVKAIKALLFEKEL